MVAKHLIQIIITGVQVVGKAFGQAVRQEIRMSQEAAKRSQSRNAEASAAENLRLGMTLDEAKQILNLTDEDLLGKTDKLQNTTTTFLASTKSHREGRFTSSQK